MRYLLYIFVVISLFTGCDKQVKTGLHEVHWDRDMCERCKMVVSDRKNTGQVIDPKTGKSYMFDDLGCLVLWFKDENIDWENKAIIYITDIKTGKFIDARKAWYDTNSSRTPMDYGFGAHEKQNKTKSYITYDEARLKILRGETMQNPQIKKGNL